MADPLSTALTTRLGCRLPVIQTGRVCTRLATASLASSTATAPSTGRDIIPCRIGAATMGEAITSATVGSLGSAGIST